MALRAKYILDAITPYVAIIGNVLKRVHCVGKM